MGPSAQPGHRVLWWDRSPSGCVTASRGPTQELTQEPGTSATHAANPGPDLGTGTGTGALRGQRCWTLGRDAPSAHSLRTPAFSRPASVSCWQHTGLGLGGRQRYAASAVTERGLVGTRKQRVGSLPPQHRDRRNSGSRALGEAPWGPTGPGWEDKRGLPLGKRKEHAPGRALGEGEQTSRDMGGKCPRPGKAWLLRLVCGRREGLRPEPQDEPRCFSKAKPVSPGRRARCSPCAAFYGRTRPQAPAGSTRGPDPVPRTLGVAVSWRGLSKAVP